MNTSDYLAFGQTFTSHPASTSQRYGFTGRETNNVNGNIYLRSRDYSPVTGAFNQRDKACYPHNPFGNLYSYTSQRPHMHTDPHGYCHDCGLGLENVTIDSALMNLLARTHGNGLGPYARNFNTINQNHRANRDAALAAERKRREAEQNKWNEANLYPEKRCGNPCDDSVLVSIINSFKQRLKLECDNGASSFTLHSEYNLGDCYSSANSLSKSLETAIRQICEDTGGKGPSYFKFPWEEGRNDVLNCTDVSILADKVFNKTPNENLNAQLASMHSPFQRLGMTIGAHNWNEVFVNRRPFGKRRAILTIDLWNSGWTTGIWRNGVDSFGFCATVHSR